MGKVMDVERWEGGLTLHEEKAIDEIAKAFTYKIGNAQKNKNISPQGLSLADQLAAATGKSPIDNSGMFPWKGYAGFRFVDTRTYEGEFDLVLVTHHNVIIVELKQWHGEVTNNGDVWYKNGEYHGRSAVSVTRNKKFLLEKKLKKIQHDLSYLKNDRNRLRVEFFVVFSGKTDFSKLPEVERDHCYTLKNFLKLAQPEGFKKAFPRFHSRAIGLNNDFKVFNKLFLSDQIKPKHLIVNGYRASEQIFPLEGVESVYKEFIARSEANKNDKALLRQWDFDRIKDDLGARTPEGRYHIVSHERDVLVDIRTRDPELYRYCLHTKTNPTEQEVTRQFHELY